jgi:leucyl-tRNA synthetase
VRAPPPSPSERGPGGEGAPPSPSERGPGGEGAPPSPSERGPGGEGAPPSPSERGPGGEGAPPSPSERGPGGEGFPLETTTMPGWAGSSWYFLRYMDPGNAGRFASKEAINYWGQVDLYVGGSEHATGHLLYFRFWTKFLHDLGLLPFDEPVKKLVNQGMIQGVSRVAYSFSSAYVLSFSMISTTSYDDNSPTLPLDAAPTVLIPEDVYERALNDKLTDADLKQLKSIERKVTEHVRALYPGHRGRLFSRAGENGAMAYKRHIDVSLVNDRGHLDVVRFRNSEPGQPEVFTWGDSSYVCIPEVEKMSKSKLNVVNPDDIISKYGADTLRLYEMFLGPMEQSKPWDTNGIEGTFRFLRKFWNLFGLRRQRTTYGRRSRSVDPPGRHTFPRQTKPPPRPN